MIQLFESNNDFNEIVTKYFYDGEVLYDLEDVIIEMLLYDVLEDCEAYMQIWDNFEYIFYLEEKAKFVLTEKGLQFILMYNKNDYIMMYLQDYINTQQNKQKYGCIYRRFDKNNKNITLYVGNSIDFYRRQIEHEREINIALNHYKKCITEEDREKLEKMYIKTSKKFYLQQAIFILNGNQIDTEIIEENILEQNLLKRETELKQQLQPLFGWIPNKKETYCTTCERNYPNTFNRHKDTKKHKENLKLKGIQIESIKQKKTNILEKITCEICNSELTQQQMKNHKNTKIHQYNIERRAKNQKPAKDFPQKQKKRIQQKVICNICNIEMNKRSFKRHLENSQEHKEKEKLKNNPELTIKQEQIEKKKKNGFCTMCRQEEYTDIDNHLNSKSHKNKQQLKDHPELIEIQKQETIQKKKFQYEKHKKSKIKLCKYCNKIQTHLSRHINSIHFEEYLQEQNQ